jgi:hypothetical protein
MDLNYPISDLEHHLSAYLNRRLNTCTHKPKGPESARLHSVKDFIAELEHGGIQLEGFTTTMSEECPIGFPQQYVYSTYTITCDALPASECFVCIKCDKNSPAQFYAESGESSNSSAQFYACVYEATTFYGQAIYDDDFGFVFRFLERFEEIAAELRVIRAKFEKRQKVNELTENSIKAWFTQICEELGCPYLIEIMKVHSKLYVKLDDKTRLEMVVQHSDFQKVMPELSGLIQAYTALFESSKARVLITNAAPGDYWRKPSKKRIVEECEDAEEF